MAEFEKKKEEERRKKEEDGLVAMPSLCPFIL